MFHTSPNKIKSASINNNGVAGSCLFFSDDVYVMTASNSYYVYEADFDCVRASQLHDDEIIADIARYFDVDESTAESLLDGTQNEWCLDDFDCEGEDSWWLQGKRGECAVKMGYDGCEDEDEQGTVYIIPMFGREDELKLVEVVNG
ncbi:TPA: hypothetical protein ACN30P_004418 [Vibrio parahaemolyticus]